MGVFLSSTTTDVGTMLDLVGELVTKIGTWIGTFVTAITSNPLILFFVGMSLVGIAVGFITRLIRVR